MPLLLMFCFVKRGDASLNGGEERSGGITTFLTRPESGGEGGSLRYGSERWKRMSIKHICKMFRSEGQIKMPANQGEKKRSRVVC